MPASQLEPVFVAWNVLTQVWSGFEAPELYTTQELVVVSKMLRTAVSGHVAESLVKE